MINSHMNPFMTLFTDFSDDKTILDDDSMMLTRVYQL